MKYSAVVEISEYRCKKNKKHVFKKPHEKTYSLGNNLYSRLSPLNNVR